MNYLDVDKYLLLVELTGDAEIHAFLDYIHYLNNVFKEKESPMTASFVTDGVFGINDIKSKEDAHDLVNVLKRMELKDFNVPDIKHFVIMHLCCDVDEVIENE